jgi:hypothetical protein
VAAVENGHDEVATWLLDAGASINQEDPKVTNAIALKGLSQTLDWLEKNWSSVLGCTMVPRAHGQNAT